MKEKGLDYLMQFQTFLCKRFLLMLLYVFAKWL